MDGLWDISKLKNHILEEMKNHIIENIKPQINEDNTDKAWWTGDKRFTVKSAFNNLRRRRMEQEWVQEIWTKGLPFKIAFFHWRVWKRRNATDANLKRMRLQVVSKCYC
uniref:Putative ovule protein n=1 Tax=Solanum chacoense TaxID=4108 RepID=A0A0V0H6S6_SOLCH